MQLLSILESLTWGGDDDTITAADMAITAGGDETVTCLSEHTRSVDSQTSSVDSMSTATTEYGSDGWSPLDYILGVGEDLDSQGDDHSAGKGWENGFVVRRIDGTAYPSVHEKFGAGDDGSDGESSARTWSALLQAR